MEAALRSKKTPVLLGRDISGSSPDGEMKASPPGAVSPLPKRRTAEKVGLLLFSLCLLVLIGAFNFHNEFRLHTLASLQASAFALVSGTTKSTATNQTYPPAQPPEFHLLIAVLTVADRYEARARLRLLRDLQPPVAAHIDLRFVLCNITWEPHRVMVALEIMRYDDIIVLNCSENMNSGKTYAFLSSLPGLFSGGANGGDKPFDFVMKTDDDAYIRYPGLVASLLNQTREDLYWGHHVPAKDGVPLFMAGMGYVLSWDLVEWIAASDIPRNKTIGPEDTLVGVWLHEGGKGKNVHSTRAPHFNIDTQPVSYDLPWPGTGYTFVPNTILVHRLKGPEKWAQALTYFNVTAGLKPSKLRISEKIALVLLPLFLLVLICALNFPNEFHLHALERLRSAAFGSADDFTVAASETSPLAPPPEFRLLIGVLTVADRYAARARLRLLRDLQPPVAAHIDLRFVLCNITWEPHRVLVALEIMRYDDIIVLNCSENMNSGKTYAFLSSLPGLFSGGANGGDKPFDFVMKADDDAYIRYPGLVASLRNQTREDLYWGHHVPAKDGVPLFMAGMGYVLSWDLVEWIATSEIPRNRTVGSEDTLVGVWLHEGGKGKNVHSTRAPHFNIDTQPVSYDLPVHGTGYTFVPNTILVHRLKGDEKWAEAISYFNVTAGLKPSKFYHLY
ncbi:hypothetical protein Taro_034187 [Colocasia esculenta]|uniref:Uncharacterized protein n=1 Tax=Colocasia esculenta TaxID=4460 RepID=A0A843VQM1_COLES|nr:hypothetical protein [Colocasia esculenta]